MIEVVSKPETKQQLLYNNIQVINTKLIQIETNNIVYPKSVFTYPESLQLNLLTKVLDSIIK